MPAESFNLDRDLNIQNNVDALGRKWHIVHIRGSALYEARPEPYRSDFQCPDEFKGRYTNTPMLLERIKVYVTKTWDNVDNKAAKKGKGKPVPKVTHEESLDNLSAEIKEALGDDIK